MTDFTQDVDDAVGLSDGVSSVSDHNLTINDSVGLTDPVNPEWFTDTIVDNPSEDPGDPTDDVPGEEYDQTDTPPELEPVPTGVSAPTIKRESFFWPVPTLGSNGRPDPDVWKPTSVTRADMGRFQVVIGGVDRTYFRDVPIVVGDYTKNEPFGDFDLQLTLPQVSIFEKPGVGALSWLKAGTGVELHRRTATGRKLRFEGLIPLTNAYERGRDGGLNVKVLGALYEADLQVHKPAFYYAEVDSGARIREAFLEVTSRHFVAPALVTTGIPTRKRGDMARSPLQFVQELLSLMTTADGTNQWTIAKNPGRQAVLRVKDITTVHYTVSAGAEGVDIDVEEDWSAAPNVYYGEGVDPDGCSWRNAKHPNERADDAPDYPYADPDQVITIGTVGDGVRLWQAEMRDHGYDLAVDGYYGPEDAYQCKILQRHAGILVDGIVGPQTWAATFQVGSNAGDLDGAWVAPLAARTEVMPRLYNARGEDLGANPAYDPTKLRVETYNNYGDGVTKRDAVREARGRLKRFATPGLQGTITLSVDPEEATRWDIDEGKNIRVRYMHGAGATGILFHIAGVVGSPEAGTVQLTVDTKARDLMTLTAIQQRNREAHSPAFTQLGNRPAAQVRDVTTWDCENGAGIIPHHALYANLMTVLKIPAGNLGTIARTWFTTSSPHCEFAVAVFSKPVTTAQILAALGGNPLTISKSWTQAYDALIDLGWLIAWGDKDQPAGYFPGLGSDSDPVTGRLVDDATWNYKSDYGDWLWVAEIASQSCFIQGRLQQAVVQ